MYDMTQNKLPAPYELNQFGGHPPAPQSFGPLPQPTMYSSFKRGGRAKSKGFATVHMNPQEISILEHLQGNTHIKDGIKSFPHLEELLKNPHLLERAHHHAREHAHHHADGGPAHEEIEHLRQAGRFGDSSLAEIGPRTQNFFNQMAGGHPSINPYSGHPEYWNIGGALKGMMGMIKGGARTAAGAARSGARMVSGAARSAAPHLASIAREALPAVLPMAQEALGNRFGGMGQAAGQALGNAATNALGPQEGPVNPYHQAIGQAIGRGAESYRGGASPSQAFGQGLETAGSHLGGGMGGAMEGMGRSIGAGNSARNVLRSGAHEGFNAMGGRQGLSDMASNVAQGFGNGGMGGARNAARQQLTDYRTKAMPQFHAPTNMNYGYGYPDEMEQYA